MENDFTNSKNFFLSAKCVGNTSFNKFIGQHFETFFKSLIEKEFLSTKNCQVNFMAINRKKPTKGKSKTSKNQLLRATSVEQI